MLSLKCSHTYKCPSSYPVHPLGPAYDLSLTEVRDNSVVVEWKTPVYTGSGPITGYHVEYAKKGSSEWITSNETTVNQRFFKVGALLMPFNIAPLLSEVRCAF